MSASRPCSAGRSACSGWSPSTPRLSRLRGAAQLRRTIRFLAEGTRSEAERRARGPDAGDGISGWVANLRVRAGGRAYVLDLAFERERITVEVDSRAFHTDADAFQRDRTRQNDLVAAGWTVLRFTWEDIVDRPADVVRRIRGILAERPRDLEPRRAATGRIRTLVSAWRRPVSGSRRWGAGAASGPQPGATGCGGARRRRRGGRAASSLPCVLTTRDAAGAPAAGRAGRARTGRRHWRPQAGRITAMGDFLRAELAAGRGYLPAGPNVLRAFARPLAEVRVLIVGQDPYPTPGHAVGLSFCVAPDVRPIPRSLANIYRELHDDLGCPQPRVRRPDAVGRPGRPAAQQGAHRDARAARARTAARAGRRSPRPPSAPWSPRWAAGRDPLGPRRAGPDADARRHPADRLSPSQPHVGRPRLLRLAPVQPGQRRAGGAGRDPDRRGACPEGSGPSRRHRQPPADERPRPGRVPPPDGRPSRAGRWGPAGTAGR